MTLLVVGSVALDSISTPFGSTADALGGSAVYFAVAASLLHPVRVVGVASAGFAHAADAVGYLTAHLALTGQWQSGLPRDAFRHVPADGPWNGMTLLRDQAE